MAAKADPVRVGEAYNRWTVESPPEREGRYLMVAVRCACGNPGKVEQTNLRKGLTRSCGCLKRELVGTHTATHGMSKTRIYAIWNMMRQRCELPSNHAYSYYGGRGISVCPSWQKFENFYSDVGDPPDGCTLDRVDSNGNYEPGNVRWASAEVQANNTRKSVRFTVNGEVLTLRELADKYEIKKSTLRSRIYSYGMTAEEAIASPILTASEAATATKRAGSGAGRIDGHKLYKPTAQCLNT